MRVLRNRYTLPAKGSATGRLNTFTRVALVEAKDGGSSPPTRTEFEQCPCGKCKSGTATTFRPSTFVGSNPTGGTKNWRVVCKARSYLGKVVHSANTRVTVRFRIPPPRTEHV